MDKATVLAPATVSNVVCGFDCLGFALAEPFDVISVSRAETAGITIDHLDDFGITEDPAANVAGVALAALLAETGETGGFHIEITKHIRPASGIGSSAASACGAVAAANIILGERFSRAELACFAMAGEVVASGTPHADNVAPCLFGGFTLIRSTDPLDIVELGVPPLFATVIHPQIEVSTAEARAILPEVVPLVDAVHNWSNLAAFVAAILGRDTPLMKRSMNDRIIEPARKHLVPRFEEVRAAAIDTGALGAGISGSGPSLFALSETLTTARAVETAMRAVYKDDGIDIRSYVSEIAAAGVRPA
jgi:homoserine kinase